MNKFKNWISKHEMLFFIIIVCILETIYIIPCCIGNSVLMSIILKEPINFSEFPEILYHLVWNKFHIIPLLICAIIIVVYEGIDYFDERKIEEVESVENN